MLDGPTTGLHVAPHLVHPRRCKSGTIDVDTGGAFRSSANSVDFFVNKGQLGRFGPDLVPILLAGRGRPGTDDVEDAFGTV